MIQPVLNYVLKKALKKMNIGTYSRNGRNTFGRICVFHRGGGNVRKYRLIDFYRRLNLFGYIYKIIYDPNRTAFIGLVFYENGLFSYIILSDNVKVGNKVYSGFKYINDDCHSKGSALTLKNISLFSIVNSIELKPGKGASLSRAAGTGSMVVSKTNENVVLKSKSGWLTTVSIDCMASIGYTSNILHNMQVIGKAGKNRGLGKRPTVRGVAMNPCDHPHGGGNGKSSPPRAAVSPWGKMTKGPHTKNKKIDKLKRKLFKKVR